MPMDSNIDNVSPTKNTPITSENGVPVIAQTRKKSMQKSAGIHSPSVDSKNTAARAIPSTMKVRKDIMDFKSPTPPL